MTARRAVCRTLWLVASLSSVSTPSSAQSPAEVGLSLRDCWSGATEASPELMELVRLELRVDGIARVPSATQSRQRGTTLWIERGCERGEGSQVVIGYGDPARGWNLERSLSLEDVPLALRERALALALAELFRAGDTTESRDVGAPDVSREAKPAKEKPETPPSSEEAASNMTAVVHADRERAVAAASGAETLRAAPVRGAAASAWQLQIGPALQMLPSSGVALFGAMLAVSWRNLTAGVLGNLGGDSDPLGDVSYRRVHGFLSYDVVSTEPAQFRIAAGLRAAFGATFANVTPLAAAVSRNVASASGDVALETSLRWLISASWQTKLSVDVGYAFGPRMQADDRDLANFSGVFVGASLCVVAAFGVER